MTAWEWMGTFALAFVALPIWTGLMVRMGRLGWLQAEAQFYRPYGGPVNHEEEGDEGQGKSGDEEG